MTAPLLSVIIPTHKRPQFLPRAVKSALDAAPNGNVEVIVVPNGGDDTWKKSLADLLHDSRVVVSPVEKGHANVARNHGLKLAKGKYVRFLDDDDFLYTQNCQKQLLDLIETGANLSISNFDIGTDINDVFQTVSVNKKYHNFVELILACDRITHVCSYLYESKFIKKTTWDITCNLGQDVLFIFDMLYGNHNINYVVCNFSTGMWVQHASERISTSFKINKHLQISYGFVMNALKKLSQQNRLLESERKIAVESLWICAHSGILYNPFFWSKKILEILTVDKLSRPNDKIYNKLHFIHPLIFELIFYPYRYIKYNLKRLRKPSTKISFWE